MVAVALQRAFHTRGFICLLCAFASALAFSQQPPVKKNNGIAAIEEEVRTQQFAQASADLLEILAREPHAGPEVYRLLAFSEYKQQNIEPALNACLQGLALYQGSRPLAELYVSILREDVSVEERLTRLTESAKQVPHSPILLKALAEELMNKDPENPQALALLSFAAKLAPQDPEVHFFYGESACFSNKDVVCIRELTRAHELSPQNDYANMQLFTMIAVAEDRRKDTVRAAQAFEQAMRANRHLPAPNPYAASKYVTFLITQSKDKEAAVVVDEILKWDPVYGPAHFERAQILARQGQTKEAAEQAELALQDSRVSTAELRTYHAFLAKTYFALGNESEARTHQDWIESHQ